MARVLVGRLGALDEQLRWRAIHALGLVAAARAEQDLDSVREWVRRQLWQMNDDSGNVAWHAPEAIAEILHRVPALCPEFASNLFARIDEELFRPGVVWGMARLCASWPALIAAEAPALAGALDDPDPAVRAHAAVALARSTAAPSPDRVRGDRTRLQIFDETLGVMRETSVGALASGEERASGLNGEAHDRAGGGDPRDRGDDR